MLISMTTSRLDELVCFAIYSAANSTSQAYRQVLAPWNLTYTQFLVLVVLTDGDRTVSELGRELGSGLGHRVTARAGWRPEVWWRAIAASGTSASSRSP